MKNVIALGYFDSVHIGHRYLIRKAKEIADVYQAKVCVSTFEDGFLSAIGRKDEEVYLLEERKKILSALSVQNCIVLPTDEIFLSLTKEQFIDYILAFSPCHVLCGNDYRFGKNAEGDSEFLQKALAKQGVTCSVEDLIDFNRQKVSTTLIKEYLTEGNIEQANLLLGEPFFVSGTVKEGRKVGRTIGFPTVNMFLPFRKIPPKKGVYATKTRVDDKEYLSVTNVGTHPTFGDENNNLETHILDFSGNLYGKTIQVTFYGFLRPIVAFERVEQLIEQIKKDVSNTKEILT